MEEEVVHSGFTLKPLSYHQKVREYIRKEEAKVWEFFSDETARKDGIEKIVSFYTKNARGAMARYIIQNRLRNINELKNFNLNGYVYVPEKSDETKFTFVR